MPIASMRRAGSVKCFAELTPKRCALVSPRSARNARHLSHSGLNCRAESGSKGAGASGLAVEGLRPTSPKAWEIMSTSLRSSGVKLISTKELAAKLDKRGRTIVDVRPAGDYDVERIPGSVNVEFYRLIEGWDPVRIARRAVFAFFGVLNGTEYNDRFLTEFEAAVPNKRNEIVLVCSIGGTLEPTGPSEFGRQSRSLTAAYEVIKSGYSKVQVLDGGLNGWKKEGRDIEVE